MLETNLVSDFQELCKVLGVNGRHIIFFKSFEDMSEFRTKNLTFIRKNFIIDGAFRYRHYSLGVVEFHFLSELCGMSATTYTFYKCEPTDDEGFYDSFAPTLNGNIVYKIKKVLDKNSKP